MKSSSRPAGAARRAFRFQFCQLRSRMQTEQPKMARLQSQIHSEPPSVPVYSYHCILFRLRAKALPSTSQGQEICASKYILSHAIQAQKRNIYGMLPLKRLRQSRKRAKTTDIWKALATLAKIPPPTVALHTHQVVNALKIRKHP